MPAPIMLWRMEFNCMSVISALRVIDKSWGQHKADVGITKYVAIAQHCEDKCALNLAFFISLSLSVFMEYVFTSSIFMQMS